VQAFGELFVWMIKHSGAQENHAISVRAPAEKNSCFLLFLAEKIHKRYVSTLRYFNVIGTISVLGTKKNREKSMGSRWKLSDLSLE
jgi:hypothetical protein